MDLRKALLQAAEHLAIPVQRELRVQPANDVEFGYRFAPTDSGGLPNLLERHRVGFGISSLLAERAQPAACDTDVGWIDVAIDVEVSDRAVQPLANQVRHIAEREDVRAAVHRNAIVIAETPARFHFFQNRFQPAVFKNDLHRKYLPPKTRRIARSHSR